MSKEKTQKRKKKSRRSSAKVNTEEILESVLDKLNDGEFAEAEFLCSKVLKTEPDNVKANYYLGLALYEKRQFEEALIKLKLSLEKDKDRVYGGYINYWLGKVYEAYHFESRDETAARKHYDEAREYEQFPSDVLLRIAQSYSWVKKEDLEQKIQLYQEGIDKFPENPDFYVHLAGLYDGHLDDTEKAIATLNNAIAKGVKSPSIWYTLGALHFRRKYFSDARSCYLRLLEFDEVSESFPVIYSLVADTYFEDGLLSEAIESYSRSIETAKEHKYGYVAYFGLIIAYYRKNQKGKALKVFDKIALDKDLYDFAVGYECFYLDQHYPEELIFDDKMKLAIKVVREMLQSKTEPLLLGKALVIDALLLKEKEQYAKAEKLLLQSLQYLDSEFIYKRLAEVYEMMFYEKNGDCLKGTELATYLESLKDSIERHPALRKYLAQQVLNTVGKHLFELRKHEEIVRLCNMFEVSEIDEAELWFEVGYSQGESGETEKSKIAYERYLKLYGESSAVLNNLANIYKGEGKVDEAISMYEKAIELDPDDEIAKGNLQRALEQKEEVALKREKERREQQKIRQFYLTAPERWPTIDKFKKRLLLTLEKIGGFSGFSELARLCGMDEHWTRVHYNALVQKGMIIVDDQKNTFEINPEILPFLEKEKSHSVAIGIIKASDEIRFKPIFNSQFEYSIYNIMIGLFPNHLVFPNMSLSSIFDYGKMRATLDSETFEFFLLSSVDICIVSTANYLPIIGYEIDSSYHDDPIQSERDKKKNEIFERGGVYLLRIRAYGEPSLSEVRKQIIESTRELGHKIDPLERKGGRLVNILEEVNFDTFGEELEREEKHGV